MSLTAEPATDALSRNSAESEPLRERPWLVVWTLCKRELTRFFRQRNRVVGAIGQPIIFWLLFGAGLGPSFRMPQVAGSETAGAPAVSYSEYFFPGTLSLILLFTAIFTTISIIEDRREGFLQSVLTAPISRWSMVLGKLLGGSLIALVQAMIFFALGLTLGLHYSLTMVLAVAAFGLLCAFALTALGFVIAWRMDSTQGFHAVMSVFLMPMWLLSGAFFPGEGLLRWVMAVNPMTYMTAGLRHLVYWNVSDSAALLPPHLPSLTLCLVVTSVTAAGLFALSVRMAAVRTTGDLL
ncbi:MAG: ABC transporter permease [Planctomycetales bacterium]|nr:ABC transporter permease [Planctomycetales bacterium]MBN8627701.1 ABC transporter permease [Planctomycetota bacterium]